MERIRNILTGIAKEAISYLILACCYALYVIPKETAYRSAVRVARIAFMAAGKKRRDVMQNMRIVTGSDDASTLRSLSGKCFENYALYWVDFFRCWSLKPAQITEEVEVVGFENLQKSIADGKGAIFALPHYGSWDLQGGSIGHKITSFWAVAERLKPDSLFGIHTEIRKRMGIKIIELNQDAIKKVIEAILDNGVVCLLSDRVVAGSSVDVEFFGHRVAFPVGPALLGIKTGCAVLPCHTTRVKNGFIGYIREPLEIEVTGDTKRDVAVATQKLARIYETFIREDPTDWHMFQPVFKNEAKNE